LVPTVAELAGEVGVSKQHLYKLLNNDTTVLNLTHADGILKALRQRGFPAKVDDLLEYRD
jgi:DNA-binding phage protein